MIDKIRKQVEAWMPDNPEGDEHISGERVAFRSVLHLLDEIEADGKFVKIDNPKPLDWWMDGEGEEHCHGYETDDVMPFPAEVYVRKK